MDKTKLKKFADKLIGLQYGVSIVMAFLLLFMIFYTVLMRYVFKAASLAVDEFMVYPIIWVYMLGGANASYEKSHIECGILTLYVKKEKSVAIFQLVKRTLCVIILAWICYWATIYLQIQLNFWKLGDVTGAPLFFAYVAMPIGFYIMEIYAIRDFILAVKEFLRITAKK